jgi:D-threo-aldose 1-dehydrogenase
MRIGGTLVETNSCVNRAATGASTVPADLATTALGHTELTITRLALGTASMSTYFWGTAEKQGVATAVAALDAGIRYFDTAPLYGLGEAESRLAAAFAERPDAARDVVVATKVGRTLVDGPAGRDAEFDFSADAVHRQLEASLTRLRRDRVDVVHVHDPDDHLPEALDGAFPALARLRREGVIKAVSVGSNRTDTVLAVLQRAEPDVVMIAGRLTLIDRTAIDELVPACTAQGVPLLAAGVFNSGILARPREGAWFDYAPVPPDVLARVARMAALCEAAGVSLQAAALQFPLRQPVVAAVVAGMSSPTEVAANVADMAVPIRDDVWAGLDELAR